MSLIPAKWFQKVNIQLIDPFKVSTAILSGVQNYWGERAAKHKLQMVDISFDGRMVEIMEGFSKLLLDKQRKFFNTRTSSVGLFRRSRIFCPLEVSNKPAESVSLMQERLVRTNLQHQ